jgi:hypothetical protein
MLLYAPYYAGLIQTREGTLQRQKNVVLLVATFLTHPLPSKRDMMGLDTYQASSF